MEESRTKGFLKRRDAEVQRLEAPADFAVAKAIAPMRVPPSAQLGIEMATLDI